jgi:hypothetical protein
MLSCLGFSPNRADFLPNARLLMLPDRRLAVAHVAHIFIRNRTLVDMITESNAVD